MIIICENCKTSFTLDDQSIQDQVFRVKCSVCEHIFTAYKAPPQSSATYVLKQTAAAEKKALPTPSHKIIAICNQKGGVGKTSTCLNLGAALSALNQRVLVVDFDLQSSLTVLLGYKKTKSFYDIVDANAEGILAALENPYPHLWLLPSNNRMMLLPNYNRKNFDAILKDQLSLVAHHFDYIVIDTPPSVEFFTLNGLAAADLVIIPTQCEFLSLGGVGRMIEIIQSIQQKRGHALPYKILATLYNDKNVAAKAIYRKLQETYQDKVFDTVIEQDDKLQESQIFKKPIIYYQKNSKSATQYLALAQTIRLGWS